MGVEKLRGLTSDQEPFDQVLSAARENQKKYPGSSVDYITARIFGSIGSQGIKRIHQILEKRLHGIPEGKTLIPVPSNSLFKELDESERKILGVDMAGVVLASLAPVVEKAGETSEFDPRMFRAEYEEYVQGTCAIRLPELTRGVVNKDEIQRLSKAGLIYSHRGLYRLHPNLPDYLNSLGILEPLTETAGPSYTSLVRSLREIFNAEKAREIAGTRPMPGDSYFGRDKVDAAILNFGRMWAEAEKREQREQK